MYSRLLTDKRLLAVAMPLLDPHKDARDQLTCSWLLAIKFGTEARQRRAAVKQKEWLLNHINSVLYALSTSSTSWLGKYNVAHPALSSERVTRHVKSIIAVRNCFLRIWISFWGENIFVHWKP